MSTAITFLEPQPDPRDVPEAFPSPFDELGPPALARRAAEALQAQLRAGLLGSTALDGPDGGKMFGVLVVQEPGGRVGYLRSFSGMLGGRWEVENFVPPLFDREARARVELPGEAAVKALLARAAAFEGSAELLAMRSSSAAMQARQLDERDALRATHATRRQRRAEQRQGLAPAERDALHALDQESRGDKAERRRLEAVQDVEAQALSPVRARLERRVRALERLRQQVCRGLMRRIQETYVVANVRGERRPLRALFAPKEPPSGAGDCAAPKLLAFAAAHALRPLALAEFWWGAPPASGGRVAGAFYGACREKCGPLLPFMLEGLSVAPPRLFAPPDLVAEPLPVVFEDAWLVVVDKPCGLLSVPGRDASVRDSVLARLRARYPAATGPLLVHRLDLDTSGLLVAALDARTHAALQRQFARREVRKRYEAWVDGRVAAERGIVALPMRVDLHDRPRQVHDPVHGKAALTEWEVLERVGVRTRLALFPRTGRTHQLRVHAAHPLGLGAAIVGDRLYGHPDGGRLLLHAQALSFIHPATGKRVSFERPAPF